MPAGIDPEHDADQRAESERDPHRPQRHVRGREVAGQEARHQQAGAVAERDADQAAERRQRHRLDQELDQDVLAPRADRLAQADLARALGHRHQHDVHDADAADQQRDADDRAHHRGDAAEHARVDLAHLVLHHDAEVVLVVLGDVVALPQHALDAFAHRAHHLLVSRPGSWSCTRSPTSRPKIVSALREGNEHRVVEVAAQALALRLHDADHRHRGGADVDLLPDRLGHAQLLEDVEADHHHLAAALEVEVGEEAARDRRRSC